VIIQAGASDTACFGLVGRSNFDPIDFGIPDRSTQDAVAMHIDKERADA
jgi:hypothetical protein